VSSPVPELNQAMFEINQNNSELILLEYWMQDAG
jgi:hypothetical protein